MVVYVNDICQKELSNLIGTNLDIVTIDTKLIPSSNLKNGIGRSEYYFFPKQSNTIYKYQKELMLGYAPRYKDNPYHLGEFAAYNSNGKHVIYIYAIDDIESIEIINVLNNSYSYSYKKTYCIHLIAVDFNNHNFNYLDYAKKLRNIDNITSLTYLTSEYFENISLESDNVFKDNFNVIFKQLAHILEYCTILEYEGKNEKYLFNQNTNDFELTHVPTYGQPDCEVGTIEDIQINKGKQTCTYLKSLRNKFAKLYNLQFQEEPCDQVVCFNGTCAYCDHCSKVLWNKVYQPKPIECDITAPITRILRLRINTDGPGVRTLVCFDQCLLHCKYCINKAIVNTNNATQLSVVKLGELIEKDAAYFSASDGGITFGGGEPLLYTSFIKRFAQMYPMISIAVETSLNVDYESVLELVDVVDRWIIDIKDLDKKIYFKYTQTNNDKVILNLQLLSCSVDQDKLFIRIPHIPSFNDPYHVENEVFELKQMGFKNIELFEYKVDNKKNKES